MKAELIKELHSMGVYRSPKTKQKLETMKLTEILEVYNMIEYDMQHGIEYKRQQCEYEFVKVAPKKEKVAKGKKK